MSETDLADLAHQHRERLLAATMDIVAADAADDWDEAARILAEVLDEHPDYGFQAILLYLCDLFREHATGGTDVELESVGPGLYYTMDGAVVPDESVGEDHRWAGRLLAARCLNDPPRYLAALGELEDLQPTQILVRIAVLLRAVNTSLLRLPAGWALR